MPHSSRRILLTGETWFTHGIHQKGFSTYTTGDYNEGQTEFVDALTSAGWAVDHIANHEATQNFPWTGTELLPYSVVVLSDVSADTLQLHPATFQRGERTPDRLQSIADYVAAGGGFLMVGGYMSFSGIDGSARFHGTAIEDILPLEMLGYDDRRETPQGVTPSVVAPDHPALGGQTEWPHFLGYNRFRPTGGEVLLTVGSDPFLTVGHHGDGRVAAFASDCSPHWGSPEFMAWNGYAPFWDGLLSWLSQGSRVRS